MYVIELNVVKLPQPFNFLLFAVEIHTVDKRLFCMFCIDIYHNFIKRYSLFFVSQKAYYLSYFVQRGCNCWNKIVGPSLLSSNCNAYCTLSFIREFERHKAQVLKNSKNHESL